ncbi:putative retrotransposon hot spot protein (RHS) [Trypanosoma cruzi]|uniref:Putative retrotransposon hot spot protein (RHS) n=1 Tax=Trypanosoma cruzi TaxID=5693 RepID=A0A2V2WRG4_TRYCR|nr:putative retrotransposon hot spot protein (RHS) [Trypanosoma cruzi]
MVPTLQLDMWRGVEETQRTEWTMSSTVEDILLEGSTLRTDMKLNDFLRNYVGGRGVEEFNENVYMKEFLISSNEFIQDELFLRTIEASPPYQEQKKEREEFYMLLEASNKLSHERIFTLRQCRDYERKGYDHSSCKGKTKRSTHAGTDRSEAGGRGKARTNAGNEIYHLH